jgi:hypothetical protein
MLPMPNLRFLLLWFLVLNTIGLKAQPNCECVSNFDAIVRKVQLNYAGFMDKTSGKKQIAYNRLCDSLRTVAARTTVEGTCFDLLAAYTLFFQDRHLQLGNYQTAKLPRTYEPLTLAKARQLTRNARRDEPVGIWRSENGKVEVAILHQPGRSSNGFDYQGIVLSSQDTTIRPGLELFRAKRRGQSYFVKAILSGRSNHQHPTKQHGNIFYAYWGMTLIREFPFTSTAAEQAELAANRVNNGFYVKPLANDVALLSLRRGFSLSDKVMDSVLRYHEPMLSQTPNLIIDLRDNGGGNNTWEKLLPYVYSKPVTWPGGWLMRSSVDNIQMIERDSAYYTPAQWAKEKLFVERLKQHMGELVSNGSVDLTIKLDNVRPNPRRVVVLINDVCASSSEFIIQIAKQSPGVSVIGSPTSGMMDYGDLRHPLPLPCPDLRLVVPMAKSPWTDTAPIDPTGILPDISLAHLPESEWLDVAVKQLQSGKLPAKP